MENIYKKIKLSIAIILASLFFQNCTAWPALTALLALAGGDKGGALLLVPPGGGGGESGGSGEAGSEPTSPNAPSNLTIPNITQTITVGIELDPKITPTFDGTVTNCTISPALPAGLSINPTTCEISGTPTGPGGTAFTEYTITATNESGSTTATVGFAVEDGSPPTIGGFSNPADPFVQGVAITPISPSSTTGVITNCTVSPALPSGLTLNTNTCVISGTPSVEASSQTYTITPSNSSGSGETQTVTFSINPAPPSNLTASITGTPTYYEDVAIAPIVISGDNIGTCAINPALPSGLTLDPNTCTISGTPDIGSAIGDTTYTITISNAGGVDETIDIAFTIEAGITGVSVNDAGPHVFWVDVTIDSIVFTATGGSITENGCQLEGSPSSLPTGLTLSRTSSSTCTISGTPEETATIQTYTVRVSNPGGHSDQTAQFQVNGAPTGPLSSSVTGTQVYTQGDAITPVTLTSAGGGPITSCSASPSLPDGLTLSNPPTNGTTCTISGAPTANATDTTYTITASNPSGSITNTITFRVEGGPQITPSATGPFVYYKDQPSAITPITFTNDGGAITGCSSSPVLPSGLSINNTTCEISGNPTVAVPTATNYTITAQAGSNNSNSVVLSITVHDEPGTITASNAGPINFIRGTAIEPINFTKPDGGPITDCSVTVGTLPAGLEVVRVDDNTCRLQGTPTAEKANETYTVRASNPAGGNDATVAFAVLGAPSNLQAVNLTTPYYVNIDPANPITFTADGGAIQSCTISEAVPTGMNFNTTTCEISGTPTAAKSSTTYTITATNSAGSTLVDVTFAVEPAPADITASITDPAVFHQGQSITPITFTKASGGQITSCTLIAPAELPTGLSLGVTGGGDSCTISGTPTDPSVVNQTYTVRAGNPAGHVDASVQFRIDGAPTSLTGTTTLLLYHNIAMTAVDYTASGGEITTCTIDPTIGGLTFTKTAANTCALSGSPAAIQVAGNHTLTATNDAGDTDLTVNIEVRGAPTAVAFTSPGSALTAGSAITPIAPTTLDGGAPTTCISDPALPTGLILNPTTCVISGTPDASLIIDPAQEYTITATNPAGSINNTISLSVYPQAPTNLTFINPGTAFTQNIAITTIDPNSLDGGTPTSCEVTATAPATDPVNTLPAGLSINPTTCAISGTPSVARDSVSYTITASNLGGSTNGTVTFSVNPAPPQNLNYAGSPYTFTQNVAITPIVPTVVGVITNCIMHASTPLPAGMSLDTTNCAISGTPTTTAASASYTVIPSNVSGDGDTASITFSIEPFPAVTSVTSPTANGAYKDGVTIPIHVVFNRNVTVIGTPAIVLNTGTPATTNVDYTSGSGSNTLVFNYTIAVGNNSPDLGYVNAASLILNGGFIRDSQNNDATLTLPIPGQPNSLSANKNIVVDTTPPVISAVAPAGGASVNSTAVSYTLSETCASGSTIWTRTGGTADPGSPHVANWSGSELNSGSRTNVILTNNPTLVDAAVYDISFNCTDPAGNAATQIVSTGVTFSESALEIISAETLDTDSNGKIDTYRISFNKPVNDTTFPGYIANSLGTVTSHWLVAGYTNVRMIHGTAVTFATDTANDAVIYLRFNENPLDCSADTTVGCDTAAKPDLTTTASPNLQDLATNTIAQVNSGSVTEIDGARPILVGARSLGANLVDAFFSEPVNLTDAEFVPNYTITPGITVTAADRDPVNTNTVRLSTSDQVGGETYTMDVATAVRDLANLNLNTNINPNNSLPGNQAIFDGLVKPVVSGIVTTSATTLRITFNEPIVASSAECSTQSSCALIYSNSSLPVLSAVSESGASNNSATFILTVNPMIQGQAYTTSVLENTAQSVASSERIGNTNNSATFNGDGKPNANISPDTATACPAFATANGVARRVIVQYDQAVLTGGGTNAADRPQNYSITGCISGDCTNGSPQTEAASVSELGANKYAIDFTEFFNTDEQIYQLRIANVQDTTGNTIPLPGTFNFQCGNDLTPPSLVSVTVVSATNSATVLILNFSEAVDNVTANVNGNYKYSANAYGFGVDSAARQTNQSQVRLTFVPGIPNGGHQLRVQLVEDLAGNVIVDNGVNNVQPFILNAPTGFTGGAVFNDPFDDGTPAANIIIYDGKLYVGADQTGSKLFESNFALTQAQTITLDADGDLFNGTDASFNGYLSDWSGCGGSSPCGTKQPISGVDTIYAGCVGGSSMPTMTGSDCTGAGGTEFMFIGALNTMGNYKSFWHTTNKSSDSTTFPFTEEWSGDAGGGAAYRSMNLYLFKDQIFVNFGAELGGGGRGGRICMNPSGCEGGVSFLNKVGFTQVNRIRRIGASNGNSLRNGSYNNVPIYGQGDGNTEVLNAINVMYEHDNDGSGGNESQLYIANGGWFTGTLPTEAPWTRSGSSDGGVVRSILTRSTKASLPLECPIDSSGCSANWEDVTPDTKEKWSRYLSIPYPQNSAVTGAGNCGVGATTLIEMDCTEPYNLFVPALKAIPYMRTAPNGDLYMLRNACSTKNLCRNGAPGTLTCDFRSEKQVCPKGLEVPQLWRMSKNCGTAANCAANGWELVAENGSSGRTDMGNPNNAHATLLEIVGNYLYVGFDNPTNGANIWRVDMSSVATGTILSQGDFTQVHVNGIGPDSGGQNQKLFSHAVVNDDGKNWLIITTRDGLGAARIYRTANDEDL